MSAPLWIDGPALRAALPYPDAVAALAEALAAPVRPVAPPRQVVETAAGQLLLMPAEWHPFTGVKLVTVAPGNPDRGLPRISGVYVLFDAATLVPIAQLDGPALTALRTAAVSALAVDRLAPAGASRLTVYGAGPQAHAHVEALAAVRPLRTVTVRARTPAAAAPVAALVRRLGLAVADDPLADADLVACCTTAREPLFDSTQLAADATVVAVGSHEPDARELDADLLGRALVVVESRASAASAGDVMLAGGPGVIDGDLAELVSGAVGPEPGRPRVFKSVGEAWEDLVVAAAVYRRALGLIG